MFGRLTGALGLSHHSPSNCPPMVETCSKFRRCDGSVCHRLRKKPRLPWAAPVNAALLALAWSLLLQAPEARAHGNIDEAVRSVTTQIAARPEDASLHLRRG